MSTPGEVGRTEHAGRSHRTLPPLLPAVLVELVSAACASFAVSPLVYIIDKSIVSNASGRQKLLACVVNELGRLARHPAGIAKELGFRWIWTV